MPTEEMPAVLVDMLSRMEQRASDEEIKESLLRVSSLVGLVSVDEIIDNWDEYMNRECGKCGDVEAEWGWTCPDVVRKNMESRDAEGEREVYCSDSCMIEDANSHRVQA
jgi:hypothetical protein